MTLPLKKSANKAMAATGELDWGRNSAPEFEEGRLPEIGVADAQDRLEPPIALDEGDIGHH